MVLSWLGLQPHRVGAGRAVELHEGHGPRLPVGFESLGALEGANPLAQGPIQHPGTGLRRRCRSGLKQIELPCQMLNGGAAAAITQVGLVIRGRLPVGCKIASPPAAQRNQCDPVQAVGKPQRCGLLTQTDQQCVLGPSRVDVQSQNAGAVELTQLRQAEVAGAIALKFLLIGSTARIAIGGRQFPVGAQCLPGDVDVKRQLGQQGVQRFDGLGHQACLPHDG